MAVGKIKERAALVALAALAMSACAKKDNYGADTTAANNAVVDTTAASSTAAAPTGLSDANIAYILDAANMSDSTWGAIAATKGTSAQVRGFGRTMMRDHHALRQAGLDLVKKLNVTPVPPSDDHSQADLQAEIDKLNGSAKGKDFDKAYIDHEVDYHKAVLDIATKAMNAAQNAELKNLIQKAAPNIQGHLDLAEKIQAGMK